MNTFSSSFYKYWSHFSQIKTLLFLAFCFEENEKTEK